MVQTNKEKNFLSAVVYVHNAGKDIPGFMDKIVPVLRDNFEHFELICVNDASTDNSVDLIRESCKSIESANVSVLNMSYYHGLEMAMNAGRDLAIGDFVFEFDSVLVDYEMDEIIKVYRRALEGYDIVSASPKEKGRLSSKLFYYVFEKFSDSSYKMVTERFRVLSRRVINRIGSMNTAIPYRKAMYSNCGLRTDTLFYKPMDKKLRFGKKENEYRKNLAVDSLILFTDLGYTFSFGMTFLMMFVAVAMLVYSLAIYFVGTPVEGWTTTILFLSVAFFGVFGILTIIIKYLELLLGLVFKRQKYSFESIEKMTK